MKISEYPPPWGSAPPAPPLDPRETQISSSCPYILIFQVHGHKKISILDGGLHRWEEDNYRTTSDVPEIRVIAVILLPAHPAHLLCIILFLGCNVFISVSPRML